jgi:BirA family biotin operon repressor/biotin-[acetyl-CoA-carboxylase] ligase
MLDSCELYRTAGYDHSPLLGAAKATYDINERMMRRSAMVADEVDAQRVIRETFVACVEHHRRIDSTNDRAKLVVAQGTGPLPLLIIADQQTAGRGRGTNRWWTGPGSLAISLVLDASEYGLDRAASGLVALATAVAVAETVAPRIPGERVGIHWPNDVYVEHRKLAGVLVELPTPSNSVVGLGLNTNNTLAEAPPELSQTAATLRDLTGTDHGHTRILVGLFGRLEPLLRGIGTAPGEIARRAHRHCFQRGQTLTIETGNRSVTGYCEGIAPNGALVLETARGQQSFVSGVLRREDDIPKPP